MITREVLHKVRRIEITTRRFVDELVAGAYHSVFKGQGIEVEEVREYVPGDDTRTIDWNVTARLGYPYVKTFIEERELNVLLVVDVSASGDFGSNSQYKNELAAEVAALLAFSAIRNNDRVGLLLFTTETELFVPPRKGRRHVLRLIRELLAHERRSEGTDVNGALETVFRMLHRKAVVFLISDFIDEGFEHGVRIAGKKHDLIALRVLDRREMEVPSAGWLAVEGAERGGVTFFNSGKARIRDEYVSAAAELRSEQESVFRSAGVDLIDLYCGEDYVEPLMGLFRRRRGRR